MVSGLVRTKGPPLGAVPVKLCVSGSPRGLSQAGRRKQTTGAQVWGRGGEGSTRKKGGPSCWGPGCSGNDRQQAWHRARPRAPSPSGRGWPPPHHTPSADATCEPNEKMLGEQNSADGGISVTEHHHGFRGILGLFTLSTSNLFQTASGHRLTGRSDAGLTAGHVEPPRS